LHSLLSKACAFFPGEHGFSPQRLRKIVRFSATFAFLLYVSGSLQAEIISSFNITANPSLFPAFNADVHDYVVQVPEGGSLNVTVTAPDDSKVNVDGNEYSPGSRTYSIPLQPGQSFSIVWSPSEGDPVTYHIRRLPLDFPYWSFEKFGTPQAEWYVTSPSLNWVNPTVGQNYLIVFDDNGLPIWWRKNENLPYDSKILPNGDIAWTQQIGFEESGLDGITKRFFNTVGDFPDIHELQPLDNGDFVVIAYRLIDHVDLSAFGGSTDATILDNLIQVIAPDGSLAWSWNPMEHISLSEVSWDRYGDLTQTDPFHMNAVDPDGDGFVVSFRHLDAIFKVNRATGDIEWKLGGTTRPESLTFQDDPYENFGGQHDARILPDGSLTVHDNGTNRNRPPRAVRYALNLESKTATLAEQVTDPAITISGCCGSARKLSEGDWVINWGLNPIFGEYAPNGQPVVSFNFGDFFAYRVNPVPFGQLDRSALRAGMDAQFPRTLPESYAPGDVNGDGHADVNDVGLILRAAVGLITLEPQQIRAADYNQDNQVDITDATHALRTLVGLTDATVS
jgi:hypothetical protein